MLAETLADFCIWCGRIIFILFYDGSYGNAPGDLLSPNGKTYTVTIAVDSSSVIATVSDKFLSLGLPPKVMLDHYKEFDIHSPKLNTLLRGLAPAYLRVGGTEADLLTFKTKNKSSHKNLYSILPEGSNCQVTEEMLALYENADLICNKKINFTITGEDWDMLNNFAFRNGLPLIFGFNALKRLKSSGKWDPTNALDILNYTIGREYQDNVNFELGNEANSYLHKFNFTLSAYDHAKDFKKLYAILKSLKPYKQAFEKSLLVGPDITQPNKKRTLKYLQQFLQEGGHTLDAITWHHYYLSSKASTTSVLNFTDPTLLDSLQQEMTDLRVALNAVGYSHTPLWMGETGSASGGGLKGVSDRYAAGFMWLDKLGMAAKNNIQVVVRQSFYSGNYALVDKTLLPMPDYWLSWIFKQLVGTKVLNVKVMDSTRRMRFYAHCSTESYGNGSITIYGMNLHAVPSTLQLPITLQHPIKLLYLLTSHKNNGLTAKLVDLNGKKLEMVDDKTLPQIKPQLIASGMNVTFPGRSYGFIVIPAANYSVCYNKKDYFPIKTHHVTFADP